MRGLKILKKKKEKKDLQGKKESMKINLLRSCVDHQALISHYKYFDYCLPGVL